MIQFLVACLIVVIGYLAYQVGDLRGRTKGWTQCLAYNDGDTPSGAEVRR